MITHPIEGKHYSLKHKTTNSNPFRGTCLVVQKGHIKGKRIFRTVITANEWHFWEDYDYKYIGDLT